MNKNQFVFPSSLPNEIENDVKLGGERKVYYALREQLMEGFYLFYNSYWSDDSRSMRRQDGECDFILAHPSWGLLFIEVKGGEISYDANTHNWYSKDYHGTIHNIKNPIKQARNSEGFFRIKIKEYLQKIHKKDLWIRTKYAVFLPESGSTNNNIGSALPLNIFAFMNDMQKLMEKSFNILLEEPNKAHIEYDEIGLEGIDYLKTIIGKSFELKTPLSFKLQEDKRILDKLTSQQKHILKNLKYFSKRIIIGGAGTGKTSLALEKVKLSATENKKVLLLCFNSPLRDFFDRKIENKTNIDIYTFHGYCYKNIDKNKIDISLDSEILDRKVLPDLLLESLESSKNKYDIIIIDEAQDFKKEWWNPILFSLDNFEKGSIFIFKDDNQKIYTSRDANFLIPSIDPNPYVLSQNMRNTKNIFKASNAFYSGDTDECAGPRGQIVELCDYIKGKNHLLQIEKILNKLIIAEGMKEHEISILTGSSINNSPFNNLNSIGNYKTTDANNFIEGSVIVDSVWRFKGLENKVVILTEIGDVADNSELLYVAITRAKLKLFIIAQDNTYKFLNKMIGINEKI